MPTHRRVPSKDEEIGKRDDDFRPRSSERTLYQAIRPWRWRRRRIFAVIAGIILLYFLLRNVPTSLETIDGSFGLPIRPGITHGSSELNEPQGPAPRTDTEVDKELGKHYYEGIIKFYRLATSLRTIERRTNGARPTNRNVLFAASSLKSVANLLPMACQMAKWDRNYVHLVVLGRNPLPLEDILEANGVDEKDCGVYFHDARSDYSEYSTDKRAEVSVAGAMKHINDFMHPQAMVMDDHSLEDQFFVRAMRSKSKEMGRALIEIPSGKYEDFLWMTRLDSGSLASWYTPTIDILVQVPRASSGGLIRLISSLENADYTGLKPPRLTIELPPNVEPFANDYLERWNWPPERNPSPLRTNMLAVHHRIPSARVTPEQASLRVLESFYPTSTENNHVLLLSPQAELSPLYFQYLYYTILEYRYSSYSAQDSEELMGISLHAPTTFINGSGDFIQPKVSETIGKKYTNDENLDQSASAPFLYQAPSSTATLIFGDKWVTFHSFLKHRIASSSAGKAEKPKKLVSETAPSWMEYLLELMRARGWYTLHPAASLLTVHSELAKIPEEYMRGKVDTETEIPKSGDESTKPDDEAFLTAPNPPVVLEHTEHDPEDGGLPLQEILPFDGDLPELSDLPYVHHNGEIVDMSDAIDFRDRYIAYFRRQIGGCNAIETSQSRRIQYTKADDLFCLPGIDTEYDDSDGEEANVAEAIVKATEPLSDDEAMEASGVILPWKNKADSRDAVKAQTDSSG